MADKSISFPLYGAFGVDPASSVPIKATDNGDGTFAIQYSAELTVDPTNLATSAKQDTAQTSLTAIAAAIGAPSDAAWTSGDGTVIALLKKIAANTAPV